MGIKASMVILFADMVDLKSPKSFQRQLLLLKLNNEARAKATLQNYQQLYVSQSVLAWRNLRYFKMILDALLNSAKKKI